MGIETRSKSNAKEMSLLSDELKNYFENLIKPLITRDLFEKQLKDLKDEVIGEFSKIIDIQNKKIGELEKKVADQSKLISTLETAVDDCQQYSRRYCVRIHGVEFKGNDDKSVTEKLKKCYSDMNLTYDSNNIDRAHYIGKEYINKQNKKVKSIIVRFRSWNSRVAFYKARPKYLKKVEPGSKSPKFSVSTDLTKRRYNLLKVAKEKVKDNPHVDYVYSDINCSLAIKFKNESFDFFNDIDDLDNLIVI